ncbi:hypothetical protein QTP86_011955 [Hemibagrus guttatus]|nr:hypothetical protein QTP86_011955 [Hemibagrus guttatus]
MYSGFQQTTKKCFVCGHLIMEMTITRKCFIFISKSFRVPGSEETIRVVSMDKDYHVDCYHCENRTLYQHIKQFHANNNLGYAGLINTHQKCLLAIKLHILLPFTGVGLGPLVPVKGTLNASAYQDILDNFMLPALWEKFGDDPFLFQHDCTPVHKERSIKTWMSKFAVKELHTES